ncbi:hypothetical protein KPL70_014563 [Citrus sinensis]|nr:hypothetical protein KPL70_014563 [Citrus sinensis]
MIANLFKPGSETEDYGIIRELFVDFYSTSGKKKPENINIFRDGVSESQFTQILNMELVQACKFPDEKWSPKFTVIVAQKNYHTKFFQSGRPENVPPGTVIDKGVCFLRKNDFYLCAFAGMIETRSGLHINYHFLHDEIGSSVDDLQGLVRSLSYVTTVVYVGNIFSFNCFSSEEVATTLLQPHDLAAVECWKSSTLLINEVP